MSNTNNGNSSSGGSSASNSARNASINKANKQRAIAAEAAKRRSEAMARARAKKKQEPTEIYTRRVTVSAKYNQSDFSESCGADIESFTYVDSSADNSDSVDITINAQESKWLKGWLPKKGASVKPNIKGKYWDSTKGEGAYTIKCGLFMIDDISYADRPSTLTISGVSKPASGSFSEKERSKVWKNTTIKRIAKTIAKRYKLKLTFNASDHKIKCYEQNGTDGSSLSELCKNYGLVMKIYAKRIWIYDREKYKQKKPIKTFNKDNILRGTLKWNTSMSGTYTGGEFSYSDSDKNQDITAKVGKGNRILKVNQRASSIADAAVQLVAALNNANHGATKISFSVDGEWKVCSGTVIKITGYGKASEGGLNGKYFVDQVTHTYTAEGDGFISTLECSLIKKGFSTSKVKGKIKKRKTASAGGGGGGLGGGLSFTVPNKNINKGGIMPGDAVKLNQAPFFESSIAKQPFSPHVSGTFYFYNNACPNGRYLLVSRKSLIGKPLLPGKALEFGYVPKFWCKNIIKQK